MWMAFYAWVSFAGFLASLVGSILLFATDSPTLLGEKLKIEQVMLFSLISIASTGVWLIGDKQQKNERSNHG